MAQEIPSNVKLPVDLRFQNSPGIKEFPQAQAVLLKDEISFRAQADGTSEFEEHDVIKVLTDRGIYQHKELERIYRSDLESVEVKRACTILPDGRVLEIPKQAIVDEPIFPESKAYKNFRRFHINYPAVQPNSIVEFHILTKRKPLPNGKWWGVTYVQNPDPVLESTFDVRVPQGSKINWATPGLENKVPEVSLDGSWDRYFWRVKDIPPFQGEPFSPPSLQVMNRIEVSNFENWSELRQWFESGWNAATETNEKITQLTQSLYPAEADPETKMKAITTYLGKKKIVPYGNEELQVRQAAEIFGEENLSPIDLGALAASMFSVAGIKVQPVLLCPLPSQKMVGQLPRANQVGELGLNVQVNGKSYWLDCEHISEVQDSPPNGYPGLSGIFGSSDPVFQDLPLGNSDNNRRDARIEARVDKTGKAEVLLSVTESGKSGLIYREAGRELLNSGKDAREQLLERLFEKIARGFSPRARVHDRFFALGTKAGEPFDLSTTLTVPGYAQIESDRAKLLLPMQRSDVLTTIGMMTSTRTQPVHIDFPHREETRLHLILPPGSTPLDVPATVQYNSPFGSYYATTRVEGNDVYHYSRLNLEQTWISPERMPEFVDFARKVLAAQMSVVMYSTGTSTATTP